MSDSKKTLEKKANTKNGILRLIFFVIAIFLEIGVLTGVFLTGLNHNTEIITVSGRIMAFLIALAIYSQNKTASIRMPWIVLILVFPAVGISLYIMIGLSGSIKRMRNRFDKMHNLLLPYLVQDEEVAKNLQDCEPSCTGVSCYIKKESGYPLYENTGVVYYPDAAEALEAQKQAMREAESFIFMEYYAIEDAECWEEIEDILTEKVKAGVEVRVFYDDFGSIGFINTDFARKLEKKGINCCVFNPMIPLLNLFLNNRDHRKMTIIDGKTGFTGGYNIANEYFNITSPYGYWKDTGVRLTGDVVMSMTASFLEMWNAARTRKKGDSQFESYLFSRPAEHKEKGFVQFYADNPMDKKPVGEDVYLNLICRAKEYLYIITPYLIITDEMSRMLGLAAKRGVDVRIVTPGIPDKKIIYRLTRSYYNRLARDGVRIFEYSPGFCHAKMCVSDDTVATCGTINMDYRSLYHHFEDGCLMIGCDAVTRIREDFENIFPQCREVTEKFASGRTPMLRFGQLVLRLFAPLM
ncbi:MAG: cardiolipin synthase [Clostridia bacterium]|nr:cardiolipin synthase [Clostridia bacterium]